MKYNLAMIVYRRDNAFIIQQHSLNLYIDSVCKQHKPNGIKTNDIQINNIILKQWIFATWIFVLFLYISLLFPLYSWMC